MVYNGGGGEQSFFAEFDGIIDAELATNMNHDQVCRLIIDTAAAAANRSAAGSSSSLPLPPSANRSSDIAAAAVVITDAMVHPSPIPPSRQLRSNPQITTRLTYNAQGMQVDMAEYRKDSD